MTSPRSLLTPNCALEAKSPISRKRKASVLNESFDLDDIAKQILQGDEDDDSAKRQKLETSEAPSTQPPVFLTSENTEQQPPNLMELYQQLYAQYSLAKIEIQALKESQVQLSTENTATIERLLAEEKIKIFNTQQESKNAIWQLHQHIQLQQSLIKKMQDQKLEEDRIRYQLTNDLFIQNQMLLYENKRLKEENLAKQKKMELEIDDDHTLPVIPDVDLTSASIFSFPDGTATSTTSNPTGNPIINTEEPASPKPSGFVFTSNSYAPTLFSPSHNRTLEEISIVTASTPNNSSPSHTSLTVARPPTDISNISSFRMVRRTDLRKLTTIVDHLIAARAKGEYSVSPDFHDKTKDETKDSFIFFELTLKEFKLNLENTEDGRWCFLKENEAIESVSPTALRKNMKIALDVALTCYRGNRYKFCHFNNTPKQRDDGWYEVSYFRPSTNVKPLTLTGRGISLHIKDHFENSKKVIAECKKHMKILCYDPQSQQYVFQNFKVKRSYENVASLLFRYKKDAEEWCKAHGGDWLPELPAASPLSTAGMFSTTNSNSTLIASPVTEESLSRSAGSKCLN